MCLISLATVMFMTMKPKTIEREHSGLCHYGNLLYINWRFYQNKYMYKI